MREIEGIGYCLHHVPDDLLEEAEQIVGFRRCRHQYGLPGACRFYAVNCTEPPMCKVHGANRGSLHRRRAAVRQIEAAAAAHLAGIMADSHAR